MVLPINVTRISEDNVAMADPSLLRDPGDVREVYVQYTSGQYDTMMLCCCCVVLVRNNADNENK
jgi:hypothetical protein